MYKPQSPWPALKQEYVPHKWMNWTERGPSVPEGPPEQPVDIIAVQGLASSYEWTWNAVLEDGRNVMWLRDLLPSDLPEARILTFEYDSKWMQTKRDDPAFVTLEDCGKRLLQSVIWDRTHKYEDEMCKTMKRRPMILIGHSYGGLVIKSAMIQAAFTNPAEPYYEDYQSFLTSVSGIVFLGTPHNGSGFARHGMTQTFWGSLFGKKSNPAILRPLAEGPASIELRELNKAFFRIKIFERNRNLKLFYFYETKRVKISGVEINLVVDKESACWGAEHGCDAPLGTDHMNMNKFGCREDENYKLVSDRLQRLHRQAKIVVSERWGKYQYTNQHASPELIELNRWLDPCRLATDVSKLRVERVEGTCKWVLTEDALLRWADTTSISDSGHEAKSYFICGKAGSGKSTLAVYIRDWLERRLRSINSGPVCTGVGGSSTCVDPSTQGHALLFFSFFGNRNLVPVIGTLVHQLLEQHSENPQLLQIATNFHKNNPELTPEAAMQLLIRLTSALSRTYIIIDGLDECDDRRRLIELLEGLCQSDRIRLLVVARKELIIEEHSRNIFPSEEMILDIALKNRDDIRFFIQGQVRMLVEKKPVLATIRDVIANRINHDSRGMFQWAKLMIDALQYLDSHESDEENVLRALEGFPQDLNGAYRKTFDRLAAIPRYDINYARAVLKLLVCATRPLTLQELAMAIELYQLLGNGSNGLSTAAEMCSQNVSSKRNNQLRERFTRLLGPMVEFHQSAAEPGHVTIHMCHHSLTQLLQGECDSMPSSKLQTPQWDSCRDFSFTPASAHEFAAQCCFQAICAGESLRTYLEGFYHKSDLPPFLGYAFENWSFHLHASGIPLETDHNLVGWVEESLRTSLHMSMFALAGVGEILGRLDFGVCFETIHMIAFRDCQTRLQDAVEAAAKVLPILPSLAGEIQKARLSGAQRRQGPTIRRRANFDSKISKPTAAFGTFLDSVLLTEVFTLIDVEPDILKPLQGYLIVLRDASRKLRRLTVALSVDPICTWLYHHIGDKGIFPVPALAQTTHILDVFISCPIMSLMKSDTRIFKRQFEVDRAHPLFGHFFSARLELDRRASNTLSQAFYKRHIIDQYHPRFGEWAAIMLAIQLMETSPSFQSGLLHRVMDIWIFQVLKVVPTHEELVNCVTSSYNIPPSQRFSKLKVRAYTMNPLGWWDGLWFMPSLLILYVTKLITTARPALETLLVDFIDQMFIKWAILPPCINALFKYWVYTPAAFIIFFLRLKYLPWLFANVRRYPWVDLTGIYNDPFNYQSTVEKISGWKMITLFIIHQIVIYLITIWMFTTKYFNDVAPEEPETTYTSQRQSSKEKLTPHLMKTTAVFWSLICVERAWHEMCYWVIDLIYTSIRIWQPSLWSWTMLVIMSSSIHWQLLGKILGPIYTLAFFFAWWLLAILCGWLRIYAFFNFMWSWTVTPIANGIWWLLNFLGAYIAYRINFAVSVITAILPTLGTRSIILLACSPVVMLVAVFGLTIMDPFRLGRARRMCRKAARTATKAYYSHTKDRRPILQQLGWKAADGQIESEVLKKVLWNLSAIRYISDTDNAEEDELEVLLRDLPGMSAHNVEA